MKTPYKTIDALELCVCALQKSGYPALEAIGIIDSLYYSDYPSDVSEMIKMVHKVYED